MPSKSTRAARPVAAAGKAAPTTLTQLPANLTQLVDSSVLSAMRYNPTTRELTLTFRDDHGTYRYSNVPPDLWSAFLAAPSKGTFLNQILKPLNLPVSRLPRSRTR